MSDAESQPISRETLLVARFDATRAVDHVEFRRITIAPGFTVGTHVHNGPVVGSILDGSAVYQIEGEPERVLNPGDVFFEPEGARISRFDPGDDGVVFLGYFLLAADEQPEIELVDASDAQGAGAAPDTRPAHGPVEARVQPSDVA
jgi:mannose-6-phosphate isomerase-like protein (cupin superfamily)